MRICLCLAGTVELWCGCNKLVGCTGGISRREVSRLILYMIKIRAIFEVPNFYFQL